MYRSRFTLALVAGALIAGCSPDTPTSPAVGDTPELAVVVNAPRLERDDLIDSTYEVLDVDSVPDGLARATFDPDEFYPQWGQVIDPDTRVVFEPDLGYAAAYGRHDYIGNVGAIETTVHVAHTDQHVGSRTARRQSYTPFLADFGRVKNIWVFPKVYSDKKCGLTVQGDSEHSASWQFFQGTGVSTWGKDIVPTQAAPLSQGACTSNTGSYKGQRTRAGGMVCTYYITYDLDTGVIYSAELLFCSTGGGSEL